MDNSNGNERDLNSTARFQLPHPSSTEDGHLDAVYTVQFAGPYIISGSKDKTIRIWKEEPSTQWRLLHPPLVGHEGSVLALHAEHQPEKDILISGGADGALIIWRFSTGSMIRTLTNAHEESILALDCDKRFLVTGSKDRTVKIWSRPSQGRGITLHGSTYEGTPEYTALATIQRHSAAVNAVRIHKDILVSGAGDATIMISNLETGEAVRSLHVHQRGITSLRCNGRFLVSGSSDNTVGVSDLANPETRTICLRGVHTNLVRSVYVDFDEESGEPRGIVSGSYDGTAVLWKPDLSSKEWKVDATYTFGQLQDPEHRELAATSDGAFDRIFSVDVQGRRLVCSGQGGVIEGWNL